jgi:hypothetical protein
MRKQQSGNAAVILMVVMVLAIGGALFFIMGKSDQKTEPSPTPTPSPQKPEQPDVPKAMELPGGVMEILGHGVGGQITDVSCLLRLESTDGVLHLKTGKGRNEIDLRCSLGADQFETLTTSPLLPGDESISLTLNRKPVACRSITLWVYSHDEAEVFGRIECENQAPDGSWGALIADFHANREAEDDGEEVIDGEDIGPGEGPGTPDAVADSPIAPAVREAAVAWVRLVELAAFVNQQGFGKGGGFEWYLQVWEGSAKRQIDPVIRQLDGSLKQLDASLDGHATLKLVYNHLVTMRLGYPLHLAGKDNINVDPSKLPEWMAGNTGAVEARQKAYSLLKELRDTEVPGLDLRIAGEMDDTNLSRKFKLR